MPRAIGRDQAWLAAGHDHQLWAEEIRYLMTISRPSDGFVEAAKRAFQHVSNIWSAIATACRPALPIARCISVAARTGSLSSVGRRSARIAGCLLAAMLAAVGRLWLIALLSSAVPVQGPLPAQRRALAEIPPAFRSLQRHLLTRPG